jgi:DNA end-binding protein Ku
VKTVEAPREAEVIDLMEALKRSLGQGGGRRKAPARKPAAKAAAAAPKTAARKGSARKRA